MRYKLCSLVSAYNVLHIYNAVRVNNKTIIIIIVGDFNAPVGIDNATWKGAIGQHGDPDINKNGRCLFI